MALTSGDMLKQIRDAMRDIGKPDNRTLFLPIGEKGNLLMQLAQDGSKAADQVTFTRLGGVPVRFSPHVPPGTGFLVPELTPLRFDKVMKLDWRPSWQRGPHPRPQTDDMRQMLDDIASEGWRK